VDAIKREQLAAAFADKFAAGRHFPSIVIARQFAGECLDRPIRPGSAAAKALDEAIEAALIQTARQLLVRCTTTHEAFDRLAALYAQQPVLGTRSSDSVRRQAYSTPLPIAIAAAAFADIEPTSTVYEPAAGNGALLLTANPALVTANELDRDRADLLRAQGFTVTQADAIDHRPDGPFDIVIANPPFGRQRGAGGRARQFQLRSDSEMIVTAAVDRAIAWRALEAMADRGRAVLLLAGVGGTGDAERSDRYNRQQNRAFYKFLYDRYGVIEHLTLSGDLYRKQGAAYPIDLIAITGRHRSPRSLPAADVPPLIRTFDELKERIPHVRLELGYSRLHGRLPQRIRPLPETVAATREPPAGTLHCESAGALVADRLDRGLPEPAAWADRVDDRAVDGHHRREPSDGAPAADDRVVRSGGRDDRADPAAPERTGSPRRGARPLAQRLERSGGGGQRRLSAPPPMAAPARPSGRADRAGRTGLARPERISQRDRPGNLARQLPTPADLSDRPSAIAPSPLPPPPVFDMDPNSRQVPYQPRSRGPVSDCLIPTNMAAAAQTALDRVERQYGDLDVFVARELGYDAPETLWQYLRAEQVDANALAFSQLDRGNIFVNGDQTGNGKGRVAASNLERAKRQGHVPIFITKDTSLFVSMVEDLSDIGRPGYRPFATNTGLQGQKALQLRDGRTLKTGSTRQQDAEMRRILRHFAETGRLPDEYDAIFTTYSQLQTIGGGREPFRRQFLRAIASRSVLVMDESHEAGGSLNSQGSRPGQAPNRAEFARELVSAAAGVVCLSATAVKDPAVLDLYARRSNARLAVPSLAALEATLRSGGVPLQQAIASQFASEGEMRRLERSMDGIAFESQTVPVDRDAADRFARVMYAIAQFDEAKRSAIQGISRSLKADAKAIDPDAATGQIGADSTNFTSLMHNAIDQALLMQKVESAVQSAKGALDRGEKPVLALSNTMESFVEAYARDREIQPGQAIDASFNDLMRRYLERSRDIATKDHAGRRERRRLTDEELGPDAVAAYEAAIKTIAESGLETFPISPIDYLRMRLESEGIRTGEITGRQRRIDYDGQGGQTYAQRPTVETTDRGKVGTIDAFNRGDLDALILNRSGSTGINLHASEKFDDRRARNLILLQPDRDVNVVMQMFGRVNRIGQVEKPKFSLLQADVPAEKRLGAILSRRMASLNANTTANRESDYTIQNVPDFFNEYGEQIATALLLEDPDLNADLSDVLATEGNSDEYPVLRRLTGRLPMLPIARQEEIYGRLETEYNDLLTRLEATGSNQLRANTLDLDARPIARMEVSPRSGNLDSEFADASYLYVIDAKAPSQALSRTELLDRLHQSLDLPLGDALDRTDAVAITARHRERSLATVHSLRDRVAAYREATVAEKTTAKAIERAEKTIDEQFGHVAHMLTEYPPGTPVRVVDEKNQIYFGVVGSIEERPNRSRHNPAAPSNWRVEIYTADNDAPIIPVSLSQINRSRDNAIFISRQECTLDGTDIYDAFDAARSSARQLRQIFAGNLLKAYAQFPQGRVVNYTDRHGDIHQGLLMPKTFEIEAVLEQQSVPLPDRDRALAFIQASDRPRNAVQTADGGLTVSLQPVQAGNDLRLTCPKTGHIGPKYYLDEALERVTGVEFYSVGDRMEATVPAERAAAVLGYLMDDRELSLEAAGPADRDRARQFLGITLPTLDPVDELPHAAAPPEAIAPPSPLPEIAIAPELLAAPPPAPRVAPSARSASQILPRSRQQGAAEKNVARFLEVAGLSEAVMTGEDFCQRVEASPTGANIPLVLERHLDWLYLTHYLEVGGDLVLDSEMVFRIDGDGSLHLEETAVPNTLTGGELRGCDRGYARLFSSNVLPQRWADAFREARSPASQPAATDDRAITSPERPSELPVAAEEPTVADPSWGDPPAEPSPDSAALDRARQWYAEARAIGRDEAYLKRIQHVGSELKRGRPLSERAVAAMDRDRAEYERRLPLAETAIRQARTILASLGRATGEPPVPAFQGRIYGIRAGPESLQVVARDRGVVLAVRGDRVVRNQLTDRDAIAFQRFSQFLNHSQPRDRNGLSELEH
jgi:predicted RNA methylase